MGFFDFLLDAVDGAITGKGNSLGAQLGKAFRNGYMATDNSEDIDWFDFCKYYAERQAYYCVCFDVEHKRGYENCKLITTFFDANENIIDQREWIVPYDKEIKQLHKTVHYPEDFLG